VNPEVVTARFRRERAMLARLDHAGIARLLGGGVSEDGSPYLVLSYVDGLPLDVYCRERHLDLLARLDLFRAVCRAVAFAHGQLVVHRDLKPANILVTPSGDPVVLDFGLAKLVKTSVGHALDSTATGHRLLTPEYASPEQVRGIRVTPAVDVYALGVVLYELLTGVRPHQFVTWSMSEITRVVCEVPAAPPSTARADDPNWPVRAHELQGGLDRVIMRAISKEPSQRHGHVAELDDDLRRYIEGRPLPASAGEHTRRDRAQTHVPR
jgi:serine/threonine protein kinase